LQGSIKKKGSGNSD